MPSSRPHRNFVVIFETVKCTLKIRIKYDYASDKSCADFGLKMHQQRLAAGLRQDPLGELTALPQTYLDLGAGQGQGKEEGGKDRRDRHLREETEETREGAKDKGRKRVGGE